MRLVEVRREVFETSKKLRGLELLAIGLHDVALKSAKDPNKDSDALIAKASYFDYRQKVGKRMLMDAEEFSSKLHDARLSLLRKRSMTVDLEELDCYLNTLQRAKDYGGDDIDFAKVVRHFFPDGQQCDKGRALMRILKNDFPKLVKIKD